MRKDVIRGVCWAIVLSAVALGSIMVDRMVRSTPAHTEPAPVSVHEAIAALPAEEPLPQPVALAAPVGQLVPVPVVEKPVMSPVRFDPVPAPPSMPPFTEAGIYLRPAPPTVIALARPQELQVALETPAPLIVDNSVPERLTNYSETDDKAPAANPAVRAMKSVGRVLGIGRKEKEVPPTGGK